MAEPLQGLELRIFRSLLVRSDRHELHGLRIELIGDPEPEPTEIHRALVALCRVGYLEEFRAGCWRLTPRGYELRVMLLGEG